LAQSISVGFIEQYFEFEMSNILVQSTNRIENRIFTIRGECVMLDSDLAEIYGVPTSRLNEQVKRNAERFPEDFMFKLLEEEWENLISQNATSSANRKFEVK
jgi:hypothetical protein